MTITVYGIKNCDTMKKAFTWLDQHKIAYTFHDYKKSGADEAVLKKAIAEHGWENVINRKGTTWRALPEKTRETMNALLAQLVEQRTLNPLVEGSNPSGPTRMPRFSGETPLNC